MAPPTTAADSGDNSSDRSKQEGDFAKHLYHIFQQRQAELKAQYGVKGGLSDEEVDLLKQLQTVEVSYGGIAISLATFWFLRGVRGQLRNRLAAANARQQQQQQQQQQTKTGFSTDGGKTFSPFHNAAQAGQQQQNPLPPPPPLPQQSAFQRFFSLFLDATFGALLGTSWSIYQMDRPGIIKRFVDTPLQAGRSGIADQFCPILTQEYNKLLQVSTDNNNNNMSNTAEAPTPLFAEKGSLGIVTIQPKTSNHNNHGHHHQRRDWLENPKESDDLKILVGFIHNCQKRHAMERRIRQDRGLGPNDAVTIPEPGVVVQATDTSFSNETDEGGGGEFYGEGQEEFWSGDHDKSNDDEWANEDMSSFVSDQEEKK